MRCVVGGGNTMNCKAGDRRCQLDAPTMPVFLGPPCGGAGPRRLRDLAAVPARGGAPAAVREGAPATSRTRRQRQPEARRRCGRTARGDGPTALEFDSGVSGERRRLRSLLWLLIRGKTTEGAVFWKQADYQRITTVT